ncbi:MAG: hypothetical protein HC911_15045 [Chloroflexaceae bacterium]|nr:hypothetical protein [Chloroflexaceae bacterium]
MGLQLLPPDQSTSAAACIRLYSQQGVLPIPIGNTPATQAAHAAGTGGTRRGDGRAGAAGGRQQRAGLGGKNHYQGIFGELYRHFGVSSYKLIRIEQYDAVLAFLEQWREAAMRGAG